MSAPVCRSRSGAQVAQVGDEVVRSPPSCGPLLGDDGDQRRASRRAAAVGCGVRDVVETALELAGRAGRRAADRGRHRPGGLLRRRRVEALGEDDERAVEPGAEVLADQVVGLPLGAVRGGGGVVGQRQLQLRRGDRQREQAGEHHDDGEQRAAG